MESDLQSRSFWLSLDPYAPNPPLEQDARVDVAVVGAGFTGLWTAYLLLKRHPGIKLIVLEKEAVGYGASGRNGGFAMTLVHRTLGHLARYLGDTEARNIYQAASKAVDHINQVVAKESIECDLQPNGVITLSNTPPQDRIIQDEFETAQRLGIKDMRFLSRGQAQARIHSERIRCAVHEAACSLVNPARLARGLKRVVEDLGATVYEGTAVQHWEESATGVTLCTPEATVQAERALVAPNAYATAWKATRPYVLPFYTYICLTERLTDPQWANVGWKGLEGAEDRRSFLHYFRPTADGRILWGGRDAPFHPDGPDRKYDRNEHVFERMRETFEWFFPQLKELPFEYRWGGPIGITGNFLPQVGFFDSKKQRAAFSFGYNGHGVAISHLAAHAIADLFAGEKTEWSTLAFVRRKPRGFGPRFLRDPMVRMMTRAQLRADDEQREARDPWVLRALNRIGGADLKIN
jgi:glycine/D-amino acid oxidase-like deaminating enzyme